MNGRRIPVNEGIVLSALEELADSVYQHRVWVAGSRTEVSGLNEGAAALFNDSGLDVAFDKNRVAFSTVIDEELKELGAMLGAFMVDAPRRTLLNLIESPEWAQVQQKATRILRMLRTQR